MSREGNLVGAGREVLVSLDLIKKGFEPFMAVGSLSFDLVAHKAGQCVRIEVKGVPPNSKRGLTGPLTSGRKDGRDNLHPQFFDVLAIVDHDDVVHYRRCLLNVPKLEPNTAVWELVKDNEKYDPSTPHAILRKQKEMTGE